MVKSFPDFIYVKCIQEREVKKSTQLISLIDISKISHKKLYELIKGRSAAKS